MTLPVAGLVTAPERKLVDGTALPFTQSETSGWLIALSLGVFMLAISLTPEDHPNHAGLDLPLSHGTERDVEFVREIIPQRYRREFRIVV
jgi:hypothetical protein